MLRTIYEMCGLGLEDVPEGKKINCNKVVISKQKEDEIISSLEEEYPELSSLEILLVLLNNRPMVDEDQSEEVVLKDEYIVEES